jgi:hypothetical protein
MSRPNSESVIEINRTQTTNRKQSKRMSFVTATSSHSSTVVNINQISKFGKVGGTICTRGWYSASEFVQHSLETSSESRHFVYNFRRRDLLHLRLNEIVTLKDSEPKQGKGEVHVPLLYLVKSWKEIQRIDHPEIRRRWNEACDAEIEGLRNAHLCKFQVLIYLPTVVVPRLCVFKGRLRPV